MVCMFMGFMDELFVLGCFGNLLEPKQVRATK